MGLLFSVFSMVNISLVFSSLGIHRTQIISSFLKFSEEPYSTIHMLPSSSNTPETYRASSSWPSPVTPRPRVPHRSVFAAETLELAEVLKETVVAGTTGAVITLLTAGLRTAHCGSFLLAENTLQPGATPQLSSDVNREETFHSLLLLP